MAPRSLALRSPPTLRFPPVVCGDWFGRQMKENVIETPLIGSGSAALPLPIEQEFFDFSLGIEPLRLLSVTG